MRLAGTSLPGLGPWVWRGMPPVWRGRPRLLCGWLVCMQAVPPGRHPLAERARGTPAALTAGRCGRRLNAT